MRALPRQDAVVSGRSLDLSGEFELPGEDPEQVLSDTRAAWGVEPGTSVVMGHWHTAADRPNALLVLTVVAGCASTVFLPLTGWYQCCLHIGSQYSA